MTDRSGSVAVAERKSPVEILYGIGSETVLQFKPLLR